MWEPLARATSRVFGYWALDSRRVDETYAGERQACSRRAGRCVRLHPLVEAVDEPRGNALAR
jgi:hypothetical protein